MTQLADTAREADRALKDKHRTVWAQGDYTAVASEVISDLGPVLVEAAGLRQGQRVLDVAAGSGNVALPAARTGAEVVASDLTPELLDRGRALAEADGVALQWQVADAEALPYAANTFDAVVSCVGVMFAPHHQTAADELVRVLRPGGTLGIISWTPAGFVGRLFATMAPYVAPPPAGVQPPPLWGTEDHVRELLGDRVTDLRCETRQLPVDRFASGAEFRDFFKACYGPTIMAYRGIVADPEKVAALDTALAELGDAALADAARNGAPPSTMPWEYLLTTAHRA